MRNSLMMMIANETYALDYAEKVGFPEKIFWNSFPAEHPDLARGLIRHALSNSTIIESIRNKEIELTYGRFASLITFGSSILKDEELLEWLRKTEQWKSFAFMNLWIDIMGNRDTAVGNADLLQIAQLQCNTGKDDQQCFYARRRTARAMGERLLGSHRDDLFQRLQAMPEKERTALVADIISAMPELFPGVNIECGENYDIRSHDIRYISAQKAIPSQVNFDSAPETALLQKYEDKLLDWIIWAPSWVDLSRTYGLMKSQEAQRRFLKYLDQALPCTLGFSWYYKKYPTPVVLQGLLSNFKMKEPYETMILFMLAESGDNSIYSLLKQKYYTKEVISFDTALYDLLAEQSARRQDYDALKLQSQRIITQLIKLPEKEKSRAPQLINILSRFLSQLIKYDALQSLPLVEGIDANNAYSREACIEAW